MLKHWKRAMMILGAALTVSLMFGGPSLAAKGGKKPPPKAPVKYTMTWLPQLEESTHSYVGGMNNDGDVVGLAGMPDGRQYAWLYTAATGTTVGLGDLEEAPADWHIQHANGINDDGQIVGGFWLFENGTNRMHAYRYTPGEGFLALGALPGLPSTDATAINNQGDVVGDAKNYDPYVSHGFVWTSGDGVMQEIYDDQQDTFTTAQDINDFGEVAGAMVVNGEDRAYLYIPADSETDSRIEDLGVLGTSKQRDSWSSGFGINNSGQVVGGSTAKRAYYERAFCYTDGDMENLGTLDDSQWSWSRGSAINSKGQVVGPSSLSTGGNYADQEHRTFLYTDATGMLDIWGLIDNPPDGMAATDVYIYGMKLNDGTFLPNGDPSTFPQISGTIQGQAFILTPDR